MIVESVLARDPGLQPERTELSWIRTLLVLLALSLHLFVIAYQWHSILVLLFALVVMCGCFIAFCSVRHRAQVSAATVIYSSRISISLKLLVVF